MLPRLDFTDFEHTLEQMFLQEQARLTLPDLSKEQLIELALESLRALQTKENVIKSLISKLQNYE